ncbi:MAG: type II secretion system F family protein [Candidatus Micrarchaeaceae archaeon]
MLFKKKPAGGADSAKAQPIGYTKQKRFLFFKIRSKPIYQYTNATATAKPQEKAAAKPGMRLFGGAARQGAAEKPQIRMPTTQQPKKPSALQSYIAKTVLKHKELEPALREIGSKSTAYEFVKRALINAIIVTVVITVAVAALLLHLGLGPAGVVLSLGLAFAVYMALFGRFLQFPAQKSKQQGKGVERDILFAARDMVVSLRSGMPLFNAITAVSTGYGEASKEFAKIVELVQLGMPIEQAIDRASEESQSKTFKRIMLQASVSIKAGADVAGALQGVVEDVTQERVIELRRYGQRLNALAMFYMLFGVIFPSMGIAVAAILTTFINIFSVTPTLLLFALVGIFFLQIIFLNVMRSSRPVFTM